MTKKTLTNILLSRLEPEDVPIFTSILDDIFPTKMDSQKDIKHDGLYHFNTKANELLDEVFDKKLSELNLVNNPTFKARILQLYQLSLVRHGIMIIGQSKSGKSTMLKVLTECLSEIAAKEENGKKHNITKFNPKSFNTSEMYGNFEPNGEFIPGIFSEIWRKCNTISKYNEWLVSDGPMDANWIENFNIVLDDNKTLGLSNGENIKMKNNCRILFEAEDVKVISPATVSRTGCINIWDTDVSVENLIQSFSKMFLNGSLSDKVTKILNKWFTNNKVLENAKRILKDDQIVNIPDKVYISSTLNLLNGAATNLAKNIKELSDAD